MAVLPRPSTCGQFHVNGDGSPTHDQRFEWVLPYHEPGIAPVGDDSGAYHVHLDGNPAYGMRFDRTFGFYCGVATVQKGEDWYHVLPDGHRAYSESWAWCGNFQHDRCTVRSVEGEYLHIRPNGSVLDGGPHSYAGDFREDCAVVRGMDGLCRHVNLEGHRVHGSAFLDLDVFHKEHARARDEEGWFHINKKGEDVSNGRRYSELEPFYNGQALSRTPLGEYVVIDEQGAALASPKQPASDLNQHLQNLSIAYWRPLAARFGILAGLAGGQPTINVSNPDLDVVRHSWVELGLLDYGGKLTELGRQLVPGEIWRDRILYWTGPQLTPWTEGEERLSSPESRADFFSRYPRNSEPYSLIHRVLDSYAIEDWSGLSEVLRINPDATVVDLGGGKGALLRELGERVKKRILVDLPDVVEGLVIDGIEIIGTDIFDDAPPEGDVYILSRVLHDWSEKKAIHLLRSIPQGSELIVIDRIAENDRFGLMSLNMLLANGGKERNENQWFEMFEEADLQIRQVRPWKGHSVMWLERGE